MPCLPAHTSQLTCLPHPLTGQPPSEDTKLVSTSQCMASVLACQFCRLQDPVAAVAAPTDDTLRAILEAPIATPLRAEAWERALADHPNPEWTQALLRGMRQGFRIGLRGTLHCRSSAANAPSALQQSTQVTTFINEQVARGFMMGPLEGPQGGAGIVTSPLAAIPKKASGRWRIIVNLSHPQNASVNDNLRRELTHVAYSSVEDAALLVHQLGRDTLMAKIDIQDAYRIIPIHPEDRRFLGIQWQGQTYVDKQLPFGLASAPAIFSAVAEALEWVLRRRGVHHVVHYLDDFLLLGSPGSSECQQALDTTIATCQELGVPLAPEKICGPSTSLSFLGVILHAASMSVQLPADKLNTLQALLALFLRSKTIQDQRSLQSLVGHLVHATKVLPLGKAFLSQLFMIQNTLVPGQIRRLNQEARADLAWWHAQCAQWSGVSVSQFLLLRQPAHHLYTDASGSWGAGALAYPNWLQIQWREELLVSSIAFKELLPIVLAAAVWGDRWAGAYILCHSDNMAAVAQVNSLHARNGPTAHLLQCLAFFQAQADCRIRAVHIPGHLNINADDLSRNRAHAVHQRLSLLSPQPTQVPPELLDLLLQGPTTWASETWRQQLISFWRRV